MIVHVFLTVFCLFCSKAALAQVELKREELQELRSRIKLVSKQIIEVSDYHRRRIPQKIERIQKSNKAKMENIHRLDELEQKIMNLINARRENLKILKHDIDGACAKK